MSKGIGYSMSLVRILDARSVVLSSRGGAKMSRLAITLLGSYQVTLDGLPLTTFATDKTRALLAYLAVEAGRFHRRDRLATLLWPTSPGRAARTSLRQALCRLRNALGDREASLPHLLVTAKGVQISPLSDYWVDVAELKAQTSAIRARHPRDETLCSDCAARLERVLELYRGDFLAGFTLPACPRFEWWQLNMQEACHHEVVEALRRLAIYHEEQQDYGSVSRCTGWQIELEPWRECAHRRRMRALALSGQRALALRQYEICRRELVRALGAEPLAETTRLYEDIRRGTLPGSARDGRARPEEESATPGEAQ